MINEVKQMSPKPTHVGYFMIDGKVTVGDTTHFQKFMIGQKVGKNVIMFQSECGFGDAMMWECGYTPYYYSVSHEEFYLIDKNTSVVMVDVSREEKTVAFGIDRVKPHITSRHMIPVADIIKSFSN